jgi:nucleotide-binding universal stress UspA family protein
VYQKILVGTDGSKTAAKAVDRAVDVARTSSAELTILSVGAKAKATQVVETEAARHADSGVTVHTMVATGDPVDALINAAREGHFDLLVLGNRGMVGVARFLRLGAVPNKVVHQHIPCSLLIVKTT